MKGLQNNIISLVGSVVDSFLPPRCFSCGELVTSQGDMCSSCWTGLNFISKPQCNCCGFPFEFSQDGDNNSNQLCGSCLVSLPPYEISRSVFRYDDASKRLILAIKYFDKLDGVEPFAKLMWRTIEPFTNDDDIIMPVPLHRQRLFKRRFNQSALLANAMAKHSKRAIDLFSLVRKRPTISQSGLSKKQRTENVKGAFFIQSGTEELRGKQIILVDDVQTTGSTIGECVRVLKKAGVKSVVVISLARVVNR